MIPTVLALGSSLTTNADERLDLGAVPVSLEPAAALSAPGRRAREACHPPTAAAMVRVVRFCATVALPYGPATNPGSSEWVPGSVRSCRPAPGHAVRRRPMSPDTGFCRRVTIRRDRCAAPGKRTR